MSTYNLVHKNTIPLDVQFLLSMSDKILPLIEKNIDVLENKNDSSGGEGQYFYRSTLTAKQYFEKRKKDFLEQQQQYSWLSWNVTDAYVKAHLAKPVVTAALNK